MDRANLQVQFFNQLKLSLPAHPSLVDLVADALNISHDSVYRRIRGEKLLEFDEIQKLCLRFNFSFDQFISIESHTFIFWGTLPSEQGFIFRNWLEDMYKHFEFIAGFKDKHFYWFVRDFPVFIHFQIPELASFKFFFWARSILQDARFESVKFSTQDISDPNVAFAKKISRLYNSIPTTEIWNVENISATLRQIEYYKELKLFKSKEDCLVLYEKLEQLVNHVEQEAEIGKKFMFGEEHDKNSATYNLYENDLILGDGTSIAKIGDGKISWLLHGFINAIRTIDPKFNEYTFQVMKNLIRKSNQISVFDGFQRKRFFDSIRAKINFSKEKAP